MKNILTKLINYFGKPLTPLSSIKVSDQKISNLIEHTIVHTRHDSARAVRAGVFASDHYLFAYVALRHFIFGGTVKIWNKALGAATLLNMDTSKKVFNTILEILHDLPVQVDNNRFSIKEIEIIDVETYKIKQGTCILVTLPTPDMPPEAFMIGIVTNEPFDNFDENNTKQKDFFLRYFALEYLVDGSTPPVTVIGEWMRDGRRNLGHGPIPDKEKFVKRLEELLTLE